MFVSPFTIFEIKGTVLKSKVQLKNIDKYMTNMKINDIYDNNINIIYQMFLRQSGSVYFIKLTPFCSHFNQPFKLYSANIIWSLTCENWMLIKHNVVIRQPGFSRLAIRIYIVFLKNILSSFVDLDAKAILIEEQ